MLIDFKSNKLKKRCEDFREASRAWGIANAKNIIRRLNEISAAPNLGELNKLPPTRCHPLTGNRKGQYSVDLHGLMRLIIEPVCDNSAYDNDGMIDIAKVESVKIIEVVDPHE
jgi:plasmid maintenance system killer protein